MATTIIQYNSQNSVVSACLNFLSTLKDVKLYFDEAAVGRSSKLSALEEKKFFFAGSKKSMSKHFAKYL